MKLDDNLSKVASICEQFKSKVHSEGLNLVASSNNDLVRLHHLLGLSDLSGDNAKMFKLFLSIFSIDVGSAQDYIQWNPKIHDIKSNGFRFYVGASATSAYAIVREGCLVAVEETDGDDGNISSFDCFAEWLEQHLLMYVESFEIERQFARKGPRSLASTMDGMLTWMRGAFKRR